MNLIEGFAIINVFVALYTNSSEQCALSSEQQHIDYRYLARRLLAERIFWKELEVFIPPAVNASLLPGTLRESGIANFF